MASFLGSLSVAPLASAMQQACALRLLLIQSRILPPQARLMLRTAVMLLTEPLCSRELQEARKIPSSTVREAQAKAASAVA